MRYTAYLLGVTMLAVGGVPHAYADDINPLVEKQGIGCTSPEDVNKFVDFLKTAPDDASTEVLLFVAQGTGIRCSKGSALIAKEDVVGRFAWADGSPMELLHLTFANGKDIYTWRMKQPIKLPCFNCI